MCDWLKRAGFDECAKVAQARAITGADILQMTEERVEQELQLSNPSEIAYWDIPALLIIAKDHGPHVGEIKKEANSEE